MCIRIQYLTCTAFQVMEIKTLECRKFKPLLPGTFTLYDFKYKRNFYGYLAITDFLFINLLEQARHLTLLNVIYNNSCCIIVAFILYLILKINYYSINRYIHCVQRMQFNCLVSEITF